MNRGAFTALLALVLLLPLSACGNSTDGERPTLHVLAASSLTDVFMELETTFEQQHAVEVQLSFGSSTDLAEQVADGAPADVLATADEKSMTLAEDAGKASDPTSFATNVLVIVTPADDPAGITGIDNLDKGTWVRCADEAPCGKVAASVLAAHHVTTPPASLEEDARSTLEKVTSGEADAALVYASDAISAGDAVRTIAIPGAEEFRASYFIDAVAGSGQADLAQQWVDLVTGPEGRQLLAEAGFSTA